MSSVAFILRTKPGKEEAYREFAANFPVDQTRHLFFRYGIAQHTVLMAGDTIVAYYETDDPFAAHRLFRDTETLGLMISMLGDVVDLDPYGGTIFYEELFTWKRDPLPPNRQRTAFIMIALPGKEHAYREFAHSFPMDRAGPLYDRYGVHQHTILMAAENIIAYYEADDASSVEKLFRDKEATGHMKALLADIIDLDALESKVFYQELFTWKRDEAS